MFSEIFAVATPNFDAISQPHWKALAWGSVILPPGTTSADAELQGMWEAAHAVLNWAMKGTINFDNSRVRAPEVHLT